MLCGMGKEGALAVPCSPSTSARCCKVEPGFSSAPAARLLAFPTEAFTSLGFWGRTKHLSQ